MRGQRRRRLAVRTAPPGATHVACPPGLAPAPQRGSPDALTPFHNTLVLEDGGCSLYALPASGLPSRTRACVELLPRAWPDIHEFCTCINIHLWPGGLGSARGHGLSPLWSTSAACRFWPDMTWHHFPSSSSLGPGLVPQGAGQAGARSSSTCPGDGQFWQHVGLSLSC